jgi:hypothetical protein
MATDWYYRCPRCDRRTATRMRLFDTLRDFSQPGSRPACGGCGADRELRVSMAFGLGAGRQDSRVLHTFFPSDPVRWQHEDGEQVTYYPVLVALQGTGGGGVSFWLPYWHTHGRKTKYGQWAPFTDAPQFSDLLAQARRAGYRL